MNAEEIIAHYDMQPLPDEGGWYVETYRSEDTIAKEALPAGFPSKRNISTAILYLITADTCSKLHRVGSDEIFHFHLGDPVTMLNIFADGTFKEITLGTDIAAGHLQQYVVAKDSWQGAIVAEGGKFALMSCTVSPGFEFEDFELADRQNILKEYPRLQSKIEKYI